MPEFGLAQHSRQPCNKNQQLPSLQLNYHLPKLTPLQSLPLLQSNHWLQRLLPINRQSRLGFSLKRCLALMPLIFLPYVTTTQALSSITAKEIHGSAPYLTFDNGVTKVTTTDGLLGITISDGTTKTTYTPANNTSTADNPIVLPVENQSFADIGMLVPTTTDSINLNALIGAPYNYWGDDDGDGQGIRGITATGSLKVSITDKNNKAVSRDTVLSVCGTPYKVVLTSTSGDLTTRYGVPNKSNFRGSTATYYISPKSANPTICSVRPNLSYGTNNYAGPADIWDRYKGFFVQSTESSSYSRNFPTTGANNLHFDLLAGGIDASTLTWPAVTQGGITATMTLNPPKDDKFNPDGASSVRVTLTGPVATEAQWNSNSPGPIDTPTLPQTFELVGYDGNNKAVIKYGFVLKQWFVSRGNIQRYPSNHASWCNSLGGYRLSLIKDLTNSTGAGINNAATPLSKGNYYQRNIGAGFFTEWGNMSNYTTTDFFGTSSFWPGNDVNVGYQNRVSGNDGNIYKTYRENGAYGVCTYP